MTFCLSTHLAERGLDPDKYQCVLNHEENEVTFFLFNLSGMLTGYQIYRPLSTDKKTNDPKSGRYFTYSKPGQDAIFGFEANTGKGPLFVFEGLFKAVKAHKLGYDAVAVLTSDPKRMRPFFRILRATRPVYAVGDADPAGEKLVRRLKAGKTSPVDFDEMSDYDANLFLKELCGA